jgi:hypothetical protein
MPFVAVPPDAEEFLRNLSVHCNLGSFEAVKLLETSPSGLAYWNCYEYARRHGGRIVCGWQVLVWPGIYIELLHHSVVEDSDGNLIDPTTCIAAHNGQAVFIEDRQANISLRNPPPIKSRFVLYPGDTNGLGQKIRDAKDHYFSIKRHLAQIIEESGPVSTPAIADYPWPRSPAIIAMLEDLNQAKSAIDDLHARCMSWDSKNGTSYIATLSSRFLMGSPKHQQPQFANMTMIA